MCMEKINKMKSHTLGRYLENLLQGANFLNIKKEIIYLNVEEEK